MSLTEFRVTRKAEDNVEILSPSGRITLGSSARQMKDAFEKTVTEGHVTVLLNMAEVDYVDSAGLGVIVNGLNLCGKKGGALILCSVQPRVEQLIELTQLSEIIPRYSNESAALEAVKTGAVQKPTQ